MAIFVSRHHHDGNMPDHVHEYGRLTVDEFARLVGHNLASARQAKGLSQEHVARMVGIAGYTYQKYEKGESRPGAPMNPQMGTLLALCQVLDVELAELLPKPWPDFTAGR
ncbi:helix-turn-helix domain-containing protein [Nocardioides sp. DS6]|uniref:Helix-turn-helix domain-containing protein n=1 Tax=Nocardioides eburneus TaxID=3231482 RepID=A0ABV3SZU2_9ACTN